MRDNNQQGPRKLLLAAGIVGSFVVYSLVHNSAGAVAPPSPSSGGNASTSTATSTPPSTSTPTGTSNGGTSTSGTGQYKNGTYTGLVTDAQWGNVQVQATVSGGQITDVKFLQYPNDRERSIEINSYADPILIQEAVQAQNAQVDIVSGATDSSEAFMQSLQDALSQAQ